MPTGLSMMIVLDGRSEHITGVRLRTDISCIRRLLVDVCTDHKAEFVLAFGTESADEVLDGWQGDGIIGRNVPAWVEHFRKAAFEADELGESPFEVRNEDDLLEIAPGKVPVFAAILDYFYAAAGPDGAVKLVSQEE